MKPLLQIVPDNPCQGQQPLLVALFLLPAQQSHKFAASAFKGVSPHIPVNELLANVNGRIG
ncbi:hypothetical protein D3C73_1668920 [compost metagenome]